MFFYNYFIFLNNFVISTIKTSKKAKAKAINNSLNSNPLILNKLANTGIYIINNCSPIPIINAPHKNLLLKILTKE